MVKEFSEQEQGEILRQWIGALNETIKVKKAEKEKSIRYFNRMFQKTLSKEIKGIIHD